VPLVPLVLVPLLLLPLLPLLLLLVLPPLVPLVLGPGLCLLSRLTLRWYLGWHPAQLSTRRPAILCKRWVRV
jgi:hypothetical protein